MTSSSAAIQPSPHHSSPFPTSPSPFPPTLSPSRQWLSMQNSSPDGTHNTELVLARRWIEECTGCVAKQKGFREYLQDGILLCELVQGVRPDLIRRIRRVKSPFAWRENLVFFLEACKSLGLKGSQLFSPEDLITSPARTPPTTKAGFRGENERRLRNVAITVFWLSRAVRRLPDYTGPLLDFDLSALGDWEHSEKLTVSHDSNLNTEPASPHHIKTRSYTPPEPTPQQQPPQQNKNSPPPPPTSPYHSPTIKVKRVESTVSHTDQTSYPQVIVHVGRRGHRRSSSSGPTSKSSSSATDNRKLESRQLQLSGKTTSVSALSSSSSKEDSIFDQLTESEKSLSSLTQELTLTQQALAQQQQSTKQLQSTTPTRVADIFVSSHSPDPPISLNSEEEEEEEEEKEEKGRESVSLQELINAELQLNYQKSLLESHNLPSDTHCSPSVSSSTPSEVSTIVPRDLASSRCSGISFPEDTGRNSATRELESDLNPLVIKHRLSATESTGYPDTVNSHPLCLSSHSLNSPGSNQVVSEEPLAEVVHSQTLFRNSPLLDVEALLSTHLPDTHSNRRLPEGRKEDSADFPSAPFPQPEPPLPPVHPSPPDATSAVGHSHLEQISEESGSEPDSHSQSADSSTCSQPPLLRAHPAVAALKEDPSSSSNCSVIEVSYCHNTESDKASNHSAPSYSSSSENESEIDNFEVVPEPVNHYVVDLEAIDSPNLHTNPGTTTLTDYHCSQSDIDLETVPEEMAVTTQVMRIYPAQSVGETSGNVAIPHHRVHLPSSSSTNSPESPSKHMSTARGSSTVLYMMPTLTEPLEKEVRLVEEENSVKVPTDHPLMATTVEDEEEEDTDSEPVSRKTSGGLASHIDPRVKMHLSLAVPSRDGGGSLARVQSDALPLTLHADKLTVPEPDASEAEENQSDCGNISDFNSVAVEIGSSLDSLSSGIATSHQSAASLAISQRSVSSSALGSHGELHAPIHRAELKHHKQQSDDSFITSVLAPSRGSSEAGGIGVPPKEPRPSSAPTRAMSDSRLPPLSLSSSSSYSSDSPNLLKIRNRRTSTEDEKQKRLANIAESARVAQTFITELHRSKKIESLPRGLQLQHSRSHSGSKSVGSEEELLGSASASSIFMKNTATDRPTDLSSPSPSLNLNNLSMDETRKASVNEMEEIWKLVENESGGSSTSVDTSVSAGGSVGVSSSRGPPSIALERHMSPQRVVSSRSSEETERHAMTFSPVHNLEEVDGGRNEDKGVKAVENGHSCTALDVSRPELSVEVPLQSTPKKPGCVQPAPPNVSLLASRQKPSSVTRKDIDSLLTTLRSLGEGGEGGEEGGRGGGEGLRLLEQMLHSNTFKRAQKVHDTVQQLVSHDKTAPKPVARRVVPIAQETRHHFHHHTEPCSEVDELRTLLRDPHIQALMFCHDRVSSEDYFIPRRHYARIKQDPVDLILSGSVLNYVPTSSLDNSLPLSRDVPSTRKEDATIVYLQRTNRPLGCTIYKQGEAVFVGKLLKGCDAELSEVLREGDELLEVNGVPVVGRSTDEIVRLMSGEAGVTLAFTIIPIHDDNVDLNFEPKYVRAHFHYTPKTDEEIPCRPLGLRFEKGDILEISNQDDPDWWQARKVFDDGAESLPGLIPARHRQQLREALRRSYPLARAMEGQQKRKGLMWKLSRKKKIFYNQGQQHGLVAVGDEVVTYEDVMRMDPHPQWRRPIILIGASGVGKGTLIRKLINSDYTHFAAVVQHTTRAIHPGEVNGHTYHFVSREEFELDLLHDRFLEHQEVKGHLYGTSVSAVKKIVESGRVPVLDLQPQSLKRVRFSGLMPYVVFVASPRLERLVVTRRVGPERPRRRRGSSSSSFDMDSNQIYTEPELQHLLRESRLIETQYSHYFDWIIVNDDLSVASDMLKEVARRAEEETQWVPASWLIDQSF